MLTPVIEDYLGTIYLCGCQQRISRAAHLAEILRVSPPTVTATLQRMSRDGWLSADVKHGIRLTPAGKRAAHEIVHKRMLIEWMLYRVLHLPWSQLYKESHRIEHSISDAVKEQIQRLVGNPGVCPHGNPIPGNEALTRHWIALDKVQPGGEAIIRRVDENAVRDLEFSLFLEQAGLLPNQKITVIEADPTLENLRLEVSISPVDIHRRYVDQIWVQPILP